MASKKVREGFGTLILLGRAGEGLKNLRSIIDRQPRGKVKVPSVDVTGATCIHHAIHPQTGATEMCGKPVLEERQNGFLCWFHDRDRFPTLGVRRDRERKAAVEVEEVSAEFQQLLAEEAEVMAEIEEIEEVVE